MQLALGTRHVHMPEPNFHACDNAYKLHHDSVAPLGTPCCISSWTCRCRCYHLQMNALCVHVTLCFNSQVICECTAYQTPQGHALKLKSPSCIFTVRSALVTSARVILSSRGLSDYLLVQFLCPQCLIEQGPCTWQLHWSRSRQSNQAPAGAPNTRWTRNSPRPVCKAG